MQLARAGFSFYFWGRGGGPVTGEIDIRLAHQLPEKPRVLTLCHTTLDKPSRWKCSDLKVRMASLVAHSKESACKAGDHLQCRRWGFDPWVRKIPWRQKWQHTPIFLPGKSNGQRSLVGYNPWSTRVGHDLANKPPPKVRTIISWGLGQVCRKVSPARRV